ncbi:cell elongation-specific peptidoglycan D,D-transpeptidase [Delftia sp. 60]|jgi:penicillin-binding protein 2|uniref:penicillin-binding protein 2 n=1 Tax=Delftia TaxID=80865 RepID=UPI000BCDC973|nr:MULTISPECIES: penicillin-binding protein 2 [Delftia]PIF35085.1 cell elongation-specific peptidoglycan D,D-transpeptidase [Burkholderiales bacterium 23]PIF64133.1 cell elongation-specific peptidoglycan D,D-transpeptidase [Delftia sp. 60]WAT86017.1 penicillin-binding protein 2 [Delftia acidovorans]SOE39211.1 cell elongation-specific peptidoglycan D,D-transpeptidase [Delftia acidovorans]
MEIRNTEAELQRFRLRAWVMSVVVLLAFGLVVARLLVLQVQRHEELAERAESNRTAVVPIVPNRGQILDRNGVVLATNYSAYTLEIMPSRAGNLEETIDGLAEIVEITPRDRRKFKRLVDDSRSFDSLPIRTRLTDDEVARFAAQRYRFPGVDIKARLFRTYPMQDTASHVIGYIGRINQREKEALEDSDDAANYRGTDVIGKLGVEQSYETDLHGQTGWEEMETSAGGHAVRKLGSRPATPGDSLVLSLDIKLQRMVEELYGDRRGALVAIDPRSGELLAMVSRPTFDLNLFVDGIDQESWTALNESINRPLLNRALRGTYPPGSTYKPFMAIAALESGKRRPDTTIMDNGSWTFGGHTFRSGHPNGPTNLRRSIIKSSNVYYYMLANDMGVDMIHDYMKPLGFGQITGIDVRGEARGVLPSTEWKRNTYKRPEQKKWYAGETISLGIGQGYNNFTILQLANAMSTLAAKGVKHRPHLAVGRVDAVTQQFSAINKDPGTSMGYKPENVEAVRAAVAAVTVEGTSRGIFGNAPYTSTGKTGTAQAVGVRQNEKYNASRLSEFQRDHSLYIAYAPADNPTIAVAVIVENAGFGAAAAAPLARRVFDYWLLGRYPSLEDMAAMRKGQAGVPIGAPRRVSEITLDAETVNLPGLPRYEPPEASVPVASNRAAALPPPSAGELED